MEWDKKTLLDFEREMLGLYVSDHPLAGTERLLARNRDTTIADLLESGRDDRGDVTVCGLITNVDKRVNKAGNVWAIITVEDMDAAVECLFFPKSYELYASGAARGRRGVGQRTGQQPGRRHLGLRQRPHPDRRVRHHQRLRAPRHASNCVRNASRRGRSRSSATC